MAANESLGKVDSSPNRTIYSEADEKRLRIDLRTTALHFALQHHAQTNPLKGDSASVVKNAEAFFEFLNS